MDAACGEDLWEIIHPSTIDCQFFDEFESHKLEEPSSSSNENASAFCNKQLANVQGAQNITCLGKRERGQEPKIAGKPVKDKAGHAKESRWALKLLNSCAKAIAGNNLRRMQHLVWVLNDLGCVSGDANQRLAAYGLKALFGKITGIVRGSSGNYEKNFHKALLKFHDASPWNQMIYTVTNAVLVDAFEGKSDLHVIDIGVSHATQWPPLIEALATRATGPPKRLKLTIVEDPFSPCSLQATEVEERLERFATMMGLNMEIRLVVSPLELLTKELLQLADGETLAVCPQFRLHKIGTCHPSFLEFIHNELEPEVMILGEHDSDETSTDFAIAFQQIISHFWNFLDSMQSAYKAQDTEERRMLEQLESIAMVQRVAGGMQRYDSHSSWNKRAEDVGFVGETPREEITETVRMLLRKNDHNWDLKANQNCMVLLWKQQPVTFCSVWRSAFEAAT